MRKATLIDFVAVAKKRGGPQPASKRSKIIKSIQGRLRRDGVDEGFSACTFC
jgi:hypothetical protein